MSSSSNIESVKIQFNDKGYLKYGKSGSNAVDKIFSGDGINLSKMEDRDENGYLCYKIVFEAEQESLDVKVYRGSVPALFLKTRTGLKRLFADKENRDEGTLALYIGTNGKSFYDDISAEMVSKLKCRGNSTFNDFEKNRIRLNSVRK